MEEKNIKPIDGIGKYTYPSGVVYEGEWEDSRRCGFGILTTKEGYTFYGIFDNNKAERGIFVMNSTDYKIAYYKSDEYFALDRSPKEILEDVLSLYGDSKKKYKNGDIFTGRTFLGLKSDEGSLEYANGDYYIGCWQSDKREGYGIQLYADKSRYIGFWKKDQKEGLGLRISKEGDIFLGIYKNNDGIIGITKTKDGELKSYQNFEDSKIYKDPEATKKYESKKSTDAFSNFDSFDFNEIEKIKTDMFGAPKKGWTQKEKEEPCPLCHGYGKTVKIERGVGEDISKFITCPKCTGKGKKR